VLDGKVWVTVDEARVILSAAKFKRSGLERLWRPLQVGSSMVPFRASCSLKSRYPPGLRDEVDRDVVQVHRFLFSTIFDF
jgi:hypothetical protein